LRENISDASSFQLFVRIGFQRRDNCEPSMRVC